MSLTVTRRKSTGALTIVGSVAGARIRRRAQSDDPKLAAEEAATIESNLLRAAWQGEDRGSRAFAEVVTSYLTRRRGAKAPRRGCAAYCWRLAQ